MYPSTLLRPLLLLMFIQSSCNSTFDFQRKYNINEEQELPEIPIDHPAVVFIETEKAWKYFPPNISGLSVGAIVNPKGYVIMNSNSLYPSNKKLYIRAWTTCGKKYIADLIHRDDTKSLALIKLRNVKNSLSSLSLRDSSKQLSPKDRIIQLGYYTRSYCSFFSKKKPCQYQGTFIRQKNKNMRYMITELLNKKKKNEKLAFFYASGNLIGPLLDSHGNLVGMHKATCRKKKTNSYSYIEAIPSNEIKLFLEAAKAKSVFN